PWPSPPVFQYIASCGTFTGPGKIRAHAARVKMPLPGRPHPKKVVQPLILVAWTPARISTATTPSPAPTKKPCTRSFRTVSESAKRNERTMTKPHITPMIAVRNVYVLLVISIRSRRRQFVGGPADAGSPVAASERQSYERSSSGPIVVFSCLRERTLAADGLDRLTPRTNRGRASRSRAAAPTQE